LRRELQEKISHRGTEAAEKRILRNSRLSIPLTVCGKIKNTVIPRHAACRGIPLFLGIKQRGIPRFSRNDNQKYFSRKLLNPNFADVSFLSLCLCISVALLLPACGYHVGGTASRLPPGLKVIAVPVLENRTSRYRIEQRMTEAVVHEFLARTKYRIVSREDSADAVLRGEITSFEASPVVFDTSAAPNSQINPNVNTPIARATAMLVSVHLKVWLEERETKKVLYRNDDYLFREPYEVSTDPATFFDEQGPAMGRMARDFASRLVADVLENF
jgi:hypothetical protein